ncbi:uncharacterized protein LOC144441171 [Glandiceps talaboti]
MDRSPITGVDFGTKHPKYGYIPRKLAFHDDFRDPRMIVLKNRSLADTHRYYSGWRRHDSKGDAFRQALWSYRMTQEYGPAVARQYGQTEVARERLPHVKEHMDLYNQEQGRRLAQTQFFGNEYSLERPAYDYIDDRYREYYSYKVGDRFIKDNSHGSDNGHDLTLINNALDSGALQTNPHKFRRPHTSMF